MSLKIQKATYVTTTLSMSWLTSVLPVARSQMRRSPVIRLIRLKMKASTSCPTTKAASEPRMMFMPWPKMLEKAACMSGTPCAVLLPSHQPCSGGMWMAKYIIAKAKVISAVVKSVRKRTPRTP